MAKWYSDKMRIHHETCKTKDYKVYHFFYTGNTQGWYGKSPRWGYVGICPYNTDDDIIQRYILELREVNLGLRSKKRFVLQMLEKFWRKEQIGLKVLHKGLSRKEALDMENFYRPEGYTMHKDKRIWNEIAGG
ncbi:hypothetical protein N9Y08_04565 [Paracoccaceae bacterium]|jgi:hypothetical protein|nr:hypothetical protein [Paracoccaceae bacterium]